uniref:Saccharopine dehydrogenase NADP binding domain-containing protein n=1 Tax=Timema monikensis TaxID=170555 RepID=A0A7R9HS96_9NEOP|nr:unnamed protein product [Timema monikensis]
MIGPSRLAVMIGPSRLTVMIGPSRLTVMIGPSRLTVMIGPNRLTIQVRGSVTTTCCFTGEDLSKVSVIVADVNDESSLLKMATQTRLVINTVGPYRFYGEAVVKACVASGAHHVDVSGEPQYMERMQLEYHEEAKQKGVYVVSACGFDSVPADLGTIFLVNKFKGDVNSVETYLQGSSKSEHKGPSIHYGTWESVVYGLAHAGELRPLREKLYPKRLPQMLPKLKPRSLLHKSSVVDAWCLPFPGADRSVIQRSQRYLFEEEKQRPVQVQAYVAFKSLLTVLAVILMGGVFGLLARSKFGRKLLLKYPSIFSGGTVSHEGPSEDSMKNTHFSITLFGEGWKEKLTDPTDQHTQPPNKTIVVKVGARVSLTAVLICCALLGNEPHSPGCLVPTLAMVLLVPVWFSVLLSFYNRLIRCQQGNHWFCCDWLVYGRLDYEWLVYERLDYEWLVYERLDYKWLVYGRLNYEWLVYERLDYEWLVYGRLNYEWLVYGRLNYECGGVYSPGAAFAKTTLIEELDKHGLKFEVVSEAEK